MAAFQDYVGPGAVAPGGHYRLALKTGLVTGLTAGQAILCWRWADTSHFLRFYRIIVRAAISTAFGTAQVSDIALFVNRNYSTNPSGGTTVLPIGSNMQAMADAGVSTNMGQISAYANSGALQVATTGALTTGTRTQDSNAIANGSFNVIALGSSDVQTLLDTYYGNEYPLTIGSNEGIEIQVPTAQGATGVVTYYINVIFAINNAIF